MATARLLSRTFLRTVKTYQYQSRTPFQTSSSCVSGFSTDASSSKDSSQDAPPFEKILIANRGEIASRILRTCRALGIQTVAVYSDADASAPFVYAADEAVCVGPAAADLSYLNVPAVLKAVRETGAQAVHPGYGFLSENESFARAITDQGAVFLGPPVSAVRDMGDKLTSKKLAAESGVNIVPGFDEPVQSVEQALQVCNDLIGYPVLLKACSGGGGKGMRVCYSDQEIRDAWGVAKAEAKKFFSDDRLLVEKYIERPHHIEFQVLAAPGPGDTAGENGTTVVVFPERECSIQRRNQKIIEESPSVLLHDSTRRRMAEQVSKLCQTVGYRSAGTVEFLVDEEQNFYFLEMNTRLQVEHPITEAVCGVDLVKGMLWIGAGWGLPPEYDHVVAAAAKESSSNSLILMPHKGHAVEARIYAEDPKRGFLPSIGPLTPYVEPMTNVTTNYHHADAQEGSYIRIDSGVAQGHAVTPHYDPMLSKVISYGPDRQASIDGLTRALDEYVIQGVQHNARLVQSVLRHESFVAGDTPTSFLPTHYPDGFHGVELTSKEQEEFAVAAAIIGTSRREWLQQPLLTGRTTTQADKDDKSSAEVLIVQLGGLFGTPFCVVLGEASATVSAIILDGSSSNSNDQQERTVQLDGTFRFEPERYLAHVTLDGTTRSIQVLKEEMTGELQLQMYGADCQVLIQSPREYELSAYMQEPIQVDTSDLVLSPMPGTLISYAVSEGDQVQDGQELCIVEAMKMQNIIRSPRVGVIALCRVEVGSSLKSDEIILEFEPEDE
jgi:propionyl-CoA carboxylase alpha chain